MNVNGELWKSVVGYEGLYEVSNFGRVKSLGKIIKLPKQVNVIKEKILRPSPDKDGYPRVGLYINGKMTMYKVHRLVLAAFVGPSNLHVNHIDLNKTNNRLDNLEYVTTAQNSHHARANKPNWAPKDDSHANTKVTFDEMVEIIFLRMVNTPTKPISEGYGIREDYIKSLKERVRYNEAYNEAAHLLSSLSPLF